MSWKTIIIASVIIIIAAGGFIWFRSTQNASPNTEKTSDTNRRPSNTPTPEELKKDSFSIEILNGSGIEGEAGRAQQLLEDAQYKVDSTANADSYDFEETIIQVGSDVDEKWLDELRSELEKKYTVQSAVEDLDENNSDSDVVIIIGSFDENGDSMLPEEEDITTTPEPTEEVTETPTPSLSPTPTVT